MAHYLLWRLGDGARLGPGYTYYGATYYGDTYYGAWVIARASAPLKPNMATSTW